MYESIALSILSSLTSFLLNNHFINDEQIIIDGAPSWYGKFDNEDKIISYGYKKGDLELLETSKMGCKKNLGIKIDGILVKFYNEQLTTIVDPYYKDFLTQYKKEQNIDTFLEKNITYDKVYFDKDNNEFFSKCSVSKKSFLIHEKSLTKNLKKSFSKYKFTKNLEELDKETNQ